MVVLVFDKLTNSQRGHLTRISLELKKNYFVMNISSKVRERLWNKITKRWDIQSIMLYTTKCEQGYKIETHNNIMNSKQIIDFDGIQLVSM